MENTINTQYHNKLGMGIYHLDTRWCSHKDFDYVSDLGIVNMYRITNEGVASTIYAGEKAKKSGAMIWVAPPIFYSRKETIEEYMQTLDKFVTKLKEAGVWDCVVGFQWDEPLLHKGHTNEDFLAMTKAVTEAYGKRIFPVFSFYEIVGKRGNDGDPDFQWLLRKECSTYITDAAFDVYGYDFTNPQDERTLAEYKRLEGQYGETFTCVEDFLRYMTGRLLGLMENPDNVRVWYFPDAYACGKRTGPARAVNEEDCINSLLGFKNLLLEQKNPGGLFSYTYKSWGDHDALDWHLNKKNPNQWKKYIEVAKQVCAELSSIEIK